MMRITVYIDVLVSLNIVFTYLFIVVSRLISKLPTSKAGVVIASFLGGLSSLIIFAGDMGGVFSFIYKLFTALVIVAIAFLPKAPKAFFKAFISFFLGSLLFGGGVYFAQATFHPENIICVNGMVYFDMSLLFLLGSVISIYGIFLIANELLAKYVIKGERCELEITMRGVSVNITALIDNGNSLTDIVSGRPVIVAELKAVQPLLTLREKCFFEKADYNNVPSTLEERIRLVPCQSVTGDDVLLCFTPDIVRVSFSDKSAQTSFCIVGVTNKSLSGGDYRALMNREVCNNGHLNKV